MHKNSWGWVGFFEIAKSRTANRTQHKVHSSSWHRDVLCQLWGHCSALLTPLWQPSARQCCGLKFDHRLFNRNTKIMPDAGPGEHWACFALWRLRPESAPWHITTFRNVAESSKEEDIPIAFPHSQPSAARHRHGQTRREEEEAQGGNADWASEGLAPDPHCWAVGCWGWPSYS